MGGRSEDSRNTNLHKQNELEFEWDGNKNKSNKEKHGIDFEEAKRFWDDPNMIQNTIPDSREVRSAAIAMYKGKHYRVITTMRKNKIRIISARRASKKEGILYDTKNKKN